MAIIEKTVGESSFIVYQDMKSKGLVDDGDFWIEGVPADYEMYQRTEQRSYVTKLGSQKLIKLNKQKDNEKFTSRLNIAVFIVAFIGMTYAALTYHGCNVQNHKADSSIDSLPKNRK